MGRPRQRLDKHQEAGEIPKLEKAEQTGWKRERLQVIRLGLEGELTYEQIASASGRCLDTIRRWFNAFREGGVQRLLERESGKGPDARNRLTPQAAEDLRAGLEAGRWRTGGIKLPPYSPELNPVEGLWDQLRDAIANKVFTTIDALEEALTAFLRPLWSDARRIFSLVLHPWLKSKQTLPSDPFC